VEFYKRCVVQSRKLLRDTKKTALRPSSNFEQEEYDYLQAQARQDTAFYFGSAETNKKVNESTDNDSEVRKKVKQELALEILENQTKILEN